MAATTVNIRSRIRRVGGANLTPKLQQEENLRRVECSDLRLPLGINNSCQRLLQRPLESALAAPVAVMD